MPIIKDVEFNGAKISFLLQYKDVKNINLRVKADGLVCVSAHKSVPQKVVEDFVLSKAEFILKAKEKYAKIHIQPTTQYFTENEVRLLIYSLCKKAYPYYERLGIKPPQIKFRKMVSRWGSCHSTKGILTFNTNLMFAPIECIEYVVWHEFTHFLQPNHSNGFYLELAKVCPDWKMLRSKLKGICIPR